MRPGLPVPSLSLALSLMLMACTGRTAGPPGSSSGVGGGEASGPVGGGEASGPGNVGGPGPTPAGSGTPPAEPAPTGATCGDKTCAAGEQCISYYGVAGPAGPKFQECAIPCQKGAENDGCPDGKRCQTIADGPGPVCR